MLAPPEGSSPNDLRSQHGTISALVRFAYLLGPIFIIISHLGTLLSFSVGLSAAAMTWMIGLYYLRMLATTLVYYRLLVHKSYQAPKLFLWVGCLIAASAGQMGPSWWKAHHLTHHEHSDQSRDPHSPNASQRGFNGFLHAQDGWLLSSSFFPASLPKDVESDPILYLIDRLHFVPVLMLAALSYWLGGVEFLVAFFVSTTLLFHGVATVNFLSHIFGTQPFATKDLSRNNWLVAYLCLGEGWHNLHHAFPYSGRHGLTVENGLVKLLPDPTFMAIRILEQIGIASRVKLPSGDDLLLRAQNSSIPEPEIASHR